MLHDLEPSTEITGGPWFSENELDTEFIDELCKVSHRFIASKSFSSRPGHILPTQHSGYRRLEDVHQFLHESRITNAELDLDNVAMLLDRLVYDGLVERVIDNSPRLSRIVSDDEGSDVFVYKAVRSASVESALGSVPCGVCPVAHMCSDTGPITPAKCHYYQQWLQL